MARIAGVDIPRDKWLWIGLRSIYGLGPKNVMDVLSKAKVDPWVKVKDLAPELEARIREVIDKEYVVEADLRREIRSNVQRLIEVGSYRGLRHRRNLPVRGQRTRTNARTKRGARQTVAGRGRRRGTGKK